MTTEERPPLPERRRLRDVELTGAAHKVYQATHVAIIGFAVATALLYVFERHHEDLHSNWGARSSYAEWGPAHSLAGEFHYIPIIAPLILAAVAVWSRRGFPRGLVTQFLILVHAVLIVGAWLSTHLFDYTEPANAAASVIPYVVLALTALWPWLFVIEIVLPIRERRRLERQDPVFATARVVQR